MYKIVCIHVHKALYISNVVAVYRVYHKINGNMILLLSLLYVAAIVTVGQGSDMSCPQDCFGGLSLYEQYCCNISNYGETVKLTKEGRHQIILCQTNRPTQCVPTSCSDVARNGGATSGYYDITLTDGTIVSVYCNMEGCDGEGGWTRVAYLNMSDPSQQCPTELRLYNQGGVRACGKQISSGGNCDSITFSTNGISYSQVCGRVIGYQYATPDSIRSTQSIDSPYVDGVSITHGSPRQHIWTLINAWNEIGQRCPCSVGATPSVPSFVGNNYFCESGNPLSGWSSQIYPDDPLWDGEGCGGDEGPCCNVPGIPWFHRALDSTTTDDIELRVCGDEGTTNEDSPIGVYEIYIK